ncbi:MAG: DUF928 domain-containing protein [Microcoleus sp. PH2017_15_JOR_U_A]|uniref:DUF928 domain-containing protein n=1 Tax=Microcoleus sp. PH2017_15_JOR_U_A TaxID=2798826 RepID=UPI001DAE659C|nr:DUF928 domain-containing protein [Microcoleus sp. PH2017_15_JOR_U_A]MCC3500524.1 DUF928 domain-containing protein [Microcoleus sp. PH2017_15_JOR_U_A]
MKTLFTCAWTLAVINATNCLVLGQVQLSLNSLVISESQQPPVNSRPPEREHTGTRGSCEETAGVHFTPLLPSRSSYFLVSTITDRPTLWFYVPYRSQSVSYGTFSLEDAGGNRVYKIDFKLPETPGIVSVNLPKDRQPLEVNKTYRWYFRLYCSSQTLPGSNAVFHTGLVKRVDRGNLDAQLQAATRENRAAIYIANQLWYDMPDLAQIRSRPDDWANILKAIDLEKLKEEKILGPVLPR